MISTERQGYWTPRPLGQSAFEPLQRRKQVFWPCRQKPLRHSAPVLHAVPEAPSPRCGPQRNSTLPPTTYGWQLRKAVSFEVTQFASLAQGWPWLVPWTDGGTWQ